MESINENVSPDGSAEEILEIKVALESLKPNLL
jgi:hypothetical protein